MRWIIWKYLGAMMTEPKGPDGEQAVSFTRLLGVVLFTVCLVIWIIGACLGSPELSKALVPDGMLFTLWGLLGIKGAKDVATGLGQRK